MPEGGLQMTDYHVPVMLQDCLEGLAIQPDGIYVDVTFGGGGHSKAILKQLGPKGKLLAFDQDEAAQQNIPSDERFVFVDQNFRYFKNNCRLHGALPADGILADLGVSSHQFDEADRGFSIRFDHELDMRMNQLQTLTAKKVIAEWTEEQLRFIFKTFGEIDVAGKLARHLINVRSDNKIETTGKLLQIIQPFSRKGQEHQFAAQVFQAIRIAVNDELESLKSVLMQCEELISTGGRLVVLSYHSLEDRLVKNYIRSGKFEWEAEKNLFGVSNTPFEAVNRKPIRPSEEEIFKNNRARSAVLRIAQRK
jgi:16S rRNA (cytosine1402-N4)-methyltransferase